MQEGGYGNPWQTSRSFLRRLQSCSRELRNFFELRPVGPQRRELPAQELWQLLPCLILEIYGKDRAETTNLGFFSARLRGLGPGWMLGVGGFLFFLKKDVERWSEVSGVALNLLLQIWKGIVRVLDWICHWAYVSRTAVLTSSSWSSYTPGI